MSAGVSLPWDDAQKLAQVLSESLREVCDEVKTVGSVRRRRSRVGDLEMLARPRLVETDLFGTKDYDFESIVRKLSECGTIIKGAREAGSPSYSPRYLQIEDVLGYPGLKADIFLVYPPANWWCLLAIRTGPAKLSQLAVTRMKAFGLAHRDGRIVDSNGDEYPVTSEEDFFEAARLPYAKPIHRDHDSAYVPLPVSDGAREMLKKACSSE